MCVELTPRQALWFLLIHEVCHAVNNPFEGHGKRFQQRILKAGEKAAEIGHLRLSKALRKEAELTKYVWIDEKREKRLISVLRKSMFKRVKPAKLELTGSRPNCKTR
jgi:hypothetical protein